ncbi:MAG: hypothetical protein P1U64_11190 [Alcanivoracaceae bacterium]|mgnify:CR=1 FL=1|jgi:hypothetical protein|nr:hypothetical protein [Alcanivoracaceae bacterium]
MKKIAVALLVPWLMVANMASAAITRNALDQVAVSVWQVRSAFHAFTVMNGDRKYEGQLADVIDLGNDNVALLAEEAETDAELGLVTELEDMWRRYTDLADSNEIVDLGYTDRYTVLDLDTLALDMHQRLLTAREERDGQGADLMTLAVKLQRIASEYMGIAASPDGGGTVGFGEGRLDFKEAVPEFEQLLEQAQAKYAGNEMVTRSLNQVAAKWNFMRESLVKFYENSVPFVVHRYSGSMVDSLQLAVIMMDS